jgi:hypothetical protein
MYWSTVHQDKEKRKKGRGKRQGKGKSKSKTNLRAEGGHLNEDGERSHTMSIEEALTKFKASRQGLSTVRKTSCIVPEQRQKTKERGGEIEVKENV